jgi:hypothetical protein
VGVAAPAADGVIGQEGAGGIAGGDEANGRRRRAGGGVDGRRRGIDGRWGVDRDRSIARGRRVVRAARGRDGDDGGDDGGEREDRAAPARVREAPRSEPGGGGSRWVGAHVSASARQRRSAIQRDVAARTCGAAAIDGGPVQRTHRPLQYDAAAANVHARSVDLARAGRNTSVTTQGGGDRAYWRRDRCRTRRVSPVPPRPCLARAW